MTTNLYPKSGEIIIDDNLSQASGALLYFFNAGTTTPLAVYTDSSLTAPHPHPVACSSAGRVPAIYLPYGSYRVRVTTSNGVPLYDYDNITNPPPPSSGGGGGIVVTQDMVFQTGWTLFLETTGTISGFVRDNGRTIGNGVSGASERANADTEALFTWIWNRLSQPASNAFPGFVSGGRGGSAAADFAAGKTITLYDKRGRAGVGVDDMGNTAASRIQVITTITTSNGSATATVGGAGGLAIGMFITASTIPAGTTITAISGTTITLSSGVGVTAGTGTAVRFSFFNDAQVAGSTGGVATITQAITEMPSHNHPGSVSDVTGDHVHTTTASSSGIGANPGVNTVPQFINTNTSSAGSHQHNLTITAQGGGLPMNNIQPAILGTWYRKL